VSAYDAVGPSTGTAQHSVTTSVTWTQAVAGPNPVVLAAVALDAAGGDSGFTTTATCGGTAMASIGKFHTFASTSGYLEVFKLVGAATGTNTIVVTVAGGTPTGLTGGSLSFSASDQLVGVGAVFSATGNSATASTIVTSNTSGNIIASFVANGGANSTSRTPTLRVSGGANGAGAGFLDGGTIAATGSPVTTSWTLPAADWWAIISVEILSPGAAPAPAPVTPRQQFRKYRTRQGHRAWQQTVSPPSYVAPVPQTYDLNGTSTTVSSATGAFGKLYISQIIGTGRLAYFADQSGSPKLGLADNPWGIIPNAGRWGGTYQTDIDGYFNARGAQGFTVIYLDPLGNTENGGAFGNGNTWDGVAPFVGGDPGVLNNTFWTRVDYALAAASRNGITIALNVCYTQDIDVSGGALFGKTNAQYTNYGTALGNRYASTGNIIWVTGNDYFDTYQTAHTNIKNGLRGAGANQPFMVHNLPESTSRYLLDTNAVQNTGTALSDVNFVYTYNCTYFGIEYAYGETSPIMVIFGDGYFYESSSNTYDATFDRAARQSLWWAYCSGARYYNFGSEGIWKWDSLALAQTTGEYFYTTTAAKIRASFEGLAGWHQLVPDTGNALITGGRGTRITSLPSGGGAPKYEPSTSNTYVAVSRTPDTGSGSDLAVMYVPSAKTVTIDQTKMKAGYTASRVDPDTGAVTAITAGANYNTAAFGNNARGGPDWVIVLQGPSGTTYPVAGSSASTSSATGAITQSMLISGSGASVSAANGTLGLAGVVSGSSATSSAANGTIVQKMLLSGSASSVSSANGVFGLIGIIAGSSVTGSFASGSITATLVTSGTSSTSSSAAGAIGMWMALSGSSATSSAANGTIGQLGAISGTSATASSTSADVALVRVLALAGSSATASSASGAIVAILALSGSSATASAANGVLSLNAVIAGSSSTQSSASGAVTQVMTVAGSSATTSSGSGSLTRVTPLAGSSSTASSASGTVVSTIIVSGISSTATTASGSLGVAAPASGTAATVSSASGAVVATIVIAGSSSTSSAASGTLGNLAPIAGTSTTVSSAVGAVVIPTGATNWRLFPVTSGPSAPISYSGNFLCGVIFKVTQGGMWFTGYYKWVAVGGDTTARKFALWQITGAGVGVLIPAATVTSGTLIAGQWNFVPLATPIPLAIGTAYNACTGWSCVHGFEDSDTTGLGTGVGDSFGTGGHISGIITGPLTAYSDGPGGGGNRGEPYGNSQGVFSVAGTDPSAIMPNSGSNSANFWMDVQVSITAPSGYIGPYRLWPGKKDSNYITSTDSPVNYDIATEFALSKSCSLDKIWYYSPPGTAQLATSANIWSITGGGLTGTLVAQVLSPSWSGPAASGWVSCAVPGSVVLPAGKYKVSVYNNAATPDNWGAKDANTDYWRTGDGANGIAWGPLSAPKLSDASLAYNYDGSFGGSTPPLTDGVTLAGQPTFAQGPPDRYPYLYSPVTSPTPGSTQNYWVDVEVSEVSFIPVSGASTSTSAANGTVSLFAALAGTSSSVSAATGALVLKGVLAGSAASVSGATGSISLTGAVTGSATSVSVAAGSIALTGVVAGSSSTQSSATGWLAGGPISGTSAAASLATGAIAQRLALSGTSATASQGSGDLTIVGKPPLVISGISATVSTASGAVVSVVMLSGSASSASSAQGSLSARGALTGTSVAVSAGLGAITLRGLVSGNAATYSSASGSVVAAISLAGLASTQSRADGWLKLPFQAGALPDEITAIVWVSNGLTASVDIDTATATIETNEISSEVT
jgi:uncharacterized protein DUF4038